MPKVHRADFLSSFCFNYYTSSPVGCLIGMEYI